MGQMVKWQASRLDEAERPMSDLGCGMLEIEGLIESDGIPAGRTDGFYLHADDLAGAEAFLRYWDSTAWTCEVYEALRVPGKARFQPPLSRLLEEASGMLFIRLIALAPDFRRRGLGREVLRCWLEDWCDMRIGAIVLDSTPAQHRASTHDTGIVEVRDLPYESPEADAGKLRHHLRGWGFHQIAGGRHMAASSGWFGEDEFAESWPPVPIDDDPPF